MQSKIESQEVENFRENKGTLVVTSKRILFDSLNTRENILCARLQDIRSVSQDESNFLSFSFNSAIAPDASEHGEEQKIEGGEFQIVIEQEADRNVVFTIFQDLINGTELTEIIEKHESVKMTFPGCEETLHRFKVMNVDLENQTKGIFILSPTHFHFQSFARQIPSNEAPEKSWAIHSIGCVIKKPYQNDHIGVEIFFDCGESIYLALESVQERDALYDCLLEAGVNEGPTLETITARWNDYLISNNEYLLHLNHFAGRTTKVLSQYPVFPWILSNYSSQNIDIIDVSCYRDLTKPIGIELEPVHHAHNVARHIGRSNPTIVHGNDVMSSIAKEWESTQDCENNQTWELTPEFYAGDGSFLKSSLFGDVELPPWAQNAHHFVQVLRAALESEHVNRAIHKWIDLVFGVHSTDQSSIEATEDDTSDKSPSAPVSSVSLKVFTHPHHERPPSRSAVVMRMMERIHTALKKKTEIMIQDLSKEINMVREEQKNERKMHADIMLQVAKQIEDLGTQIDEAVVAPNNDEKQELMESDEANSHQQKQADDSYISQSSIAYLKQAKEGANNLHQLFDDVVNAKFKHTNHELRRLQENMDDMVKQYDELRKEIESLQVHVTEAEQSKSDTELQLQESNKTIESLQANMDETAKQYDALHKEMESLQAHVTEVEQSKSDTELQLQGANKTIESLQENIVSGQKELETERTEVRKWREDYERIEDEMRELQGTKDELHKRSEDLKTRLYDSVKECEILHLHLSSIREVLRTLLGDSDTSEESENSYGKNCDLARMIREQFQHKDKQYTQLKMELAETQEEMKKLSFQLTDANGQIENMNTQISSMQEHESKLKDQVNELQVEITTQGAQIEERQTEVINLKTELHETQEENSRLNSIINELREQEKSLNTQLEETRGQEVNLVAQISELMIQEKNLDTQVDKLNTEVNELRQEISNLTAQVGEQGKEISSQEEIIKTKELQISELKDVETKLNTQLRELREENVSQQDLIQAQEVQTSELQISVEQLENSKNDLETRLAMTEEEIREKEQTIENMSNDLCSEKETVQELKDLLMELDKDQQLINAKNTIEGLRKAIDAERRRVDRFLRLSSLNNDTERYMEQLEDKLNGSHQKFLGVKEERGELKRKLRLQRVGLEKKIQMLERQLNEENYQTQRLMLEKHEETERRERVDHINQNLVTEIRQLRLNCAFLEKKVNHIYKSTKVVSELAHYDNHIPHEIMYVDGVRSGNVSQQTSPSSRMHSARSRGERIGTATASTASTPRNRRGNTLSPREQIDVPRNPYYLSKGMVEENAMRAVVEQVADDLNNLINSDPENDEKSLRVESIETPRRQKPQDENTKSGRHNATPKLSSAVSTSAIRTKRSSKKPAIPSTPTRRGRSTMSHTRPNLTTKRTLGRRGTEKGDYQQKRVREEVTLSATQIMDDMNALLDGDDTIDEIGIVDSSKSEADDTTTDVEVTLRQKLIAELGLQLKAEDFLIGEETVNDINP